MTTADSFRSGYAAYRSGDYAQARKFLKSSRHPQALHLLGLVERRSGNYAAASEYLVQAAKLEPRNHEIPHNQALLELDFDNAAVAESLARQALTLKPDFFAAGNTLARALRLQKQWRDAGEIYTRQLASKPRDIISRYGMASVLLETGDPRGALALLDELISGDPQNAAKLFMRGRAHQELGNLTAALDDYQHSFALEPTPQSLRVLGNLLWMTGETDGLSKLLATAGDSPGLRATRAELLRERGTPAEAVTAVTPVPGRPADVNELSVQALAHIDNEDAAAAEGSARAALASAPLHPLATSALITALLMQGDAEQALHWINPMRSAEPLGQHWIAYEATALRLCRSADYAQLVELDRFVQAFELPVPPAYDSLQHFNEVFLAELQQHHHYKTHPLDQSLRHGSQTSRDLRSIDAPVVKDYFAALDTPIKRYLEHVGRSPDHPLTARNVGTYEFAGCWSVLLHGQGRHINHVHPEGWISSAYYVSVPPETADSVAKPGWIKFAEPPFATVPASPPEKWVQPHAGMVVLFPSYLWHGTNPIETESLRVTAPFDLVPASA